MSFVDAIAKDSEAVEGLLALDRLVRTGARAEVRECFEGIEAKDGALMASLWTGYVALSSPADLRRMVDRFGFMLSEMTEEEYDQALLDWESRYGNAAVPAETKVRLWDGQQPHDESQPKSAKDEREK